MLLYHYLWFFFLYAFLGWCTEVAFAAVKHGVFVNRGFLNGPLCPIYGIGVAIVVYLLTPLSDNLLVLFFGSMVLTSALEFLTGWVLETIFHAKWWDYTENRFNLKGYICLEFSILWGLAATFVLRIIHPLIAKFVSLIPLTLGKVLLIVLLALLLFDLVATLLAIRRLQSRLRGISALAGEIHHLSDRIGESLSGYVLTARQKIEDEQDFYAEYTALCEANEQAEKALAQEHRTEELALLEKLRAENKHRSTLAFEEKRQALTAKLQEHRPLQLRILRAFPTLTVREGQDALDRLREATRKTKKKHNDSEQS